MNKWDGQQVNPMITASVIGASGYSGMELVTLLLRHRCVTIEHLFANTSAGTQVEDLYRRHRGAISKTYESLDTEKAAESDVVFIALPSGHAMEIVPELLRGGARVIDLGGDFRLQDVALYNKYYGREHTAPELLPHAVYGLSEWNRPSIIGADLIANPGCFPTSAILPLAPVVHEGVVDPAGIVITSMSGVSGAGRSASVDLSYAEMFGNVRAYRAPDHQHVPEIGAALTVIAGETVSPTFIPHLIPVARGIHTTITAPLTRTLSIDDLTDILAKQYANEPLVRYSATDYPAIANVVNTSYIDIGYRIDVANNRLILFSAIDNLLKGAAGQAMHNMNIMFGFSETEGLL